ncbi:Rap family tetratricopeptide repeat protein [Shouchella clausii]|uniref:Rap family tetratricopeptide repeat protein n=1 Tax=Shouchella clausii TaxID=79880 RepID=UPI000BA711F0|nr:Rap family tetratricopeptide repeat protein [Shouchella clausii]PAD16567.1 hypothetical protein CHH73_11815 [Shouchella clausii]
MNAVRNSEIGKKVAQLYRCIVKRQVQQAAILKEELDVCFKELLRDDKMVAYYNLVCFRYQMMLEQLQEPHQLEALVNCLQSDFLLNYYYYFFSGQYAFYKERFTEAVDLYEQAEKELAHIQDEMEHGEFYYRAGVCYYKIDRFDRAMPYLDKARRFFALDPMYVEKELQAEMILGNILSETGQYEKAEAHFLNLLERAAGLEETEGLILRSLGQNAVRNHHFYKAETYYQQALAHSGHRTSRYSTKTKAELANALFRQQPPKVEKGSKLLKEALRASGGGLSTNSLKRFSGEERFRIRIGQAWSFQSIWAG